MSRKKKRQPIALISVADKKGIVQFARALIKLGFMILASGGTAKKLREAGLPVTDTAEFIGNAYATLFQRIAKKKKHIVPRRVLNAIRKEIGGAILDHRVVTLDQRIHGGLLALNTPEHLADLKKICAEWIDIACVDFYPLQKEIDRPGATRQSVIEMIDIGGPTMLDATAKGGRIPICTREDRKRVIKALRSKRGVTEQLRNELIEKAFFTVSQYYMAAARYLSGGEYEALFGVRVGTNKYGENPYQVPAYRYSGLTGDPLALDKFIQVMGAEPGHVNWTDFSRLLQTITHIAATFDQNSRKYDCYAVGNKHGNACGAAYGNNPVTVMRKMIRGNPRAIWGGMISTNFPIGAAEARVIREYMTKKKKRIIDGIIAPAISEEAIQILKRPRGACKMLINPALATPTLDTARVFTQIRGGFLTQPNFTYIFRFDYPTVECFGRLSRTQKDDVLLAAAVCQTSNSNTTTLALRGMIIGNGTTRPDRLDATEVAIKAARDQKHKTRKAVAVTDSFFPFDDGPRALIAAGISIILTVSGSVADEIVKNTILSAGVTLIWLPVGDGRMFFGHTGN
ncbi:hypothetical protein KKF61_05980 [Patescibacteria group bacterium]|nr:hypothetical protein [Patescibacteria group bacterium]MBU0963845.1 hypothetical protein [Patescibacteria group bacterium]